MIEFGIPHILLYILIAIYFVCLPKLFAKAGHPKPNDGYIPGYNFYILLKLMKKPWWWLLLLCIPGINFLMLIIINVNISFCFNKRSFKDAFLAILVPHYVIPKIAFSPDESQETKFVGPLVWKNKKEKGLIREWGDALLFAIVAAGIIRGYMFEAFTIPTGSMEKDLLIGDYLFVNKIAYGPKLPNTPLSIPFFHNTIPGGYAKSYLEWFKMDYHRLPGYTSVKNNDIVVFNYPTGDTAILGRNSSGSELQGHNYYQFVRDEALFIAGSLVNLEANPEKFYAQARENILVDNEIKHMRTKTSGYAIRPVDKKENYIKRCVGIAGDTLEIIDGILYINGKENHMDEDLQFNYIYEGGNVSKTKLKKKLDINRNEYMPNDGRGFSTVPLPLNKVEEFKNITRVTKLEKDIYPKGFKHPYGGYLPIFPNHKLYEDWTRDNFGPLVLPKRGLEIEINEKSFALYRRAIEAYEMNKVRVHDGVIYINNVAATHYTFKMNYYWLMGDNRHNSADSRMWGYVPEDHVVGKAAFIWYSKDSDEKYGGVRWDRIFQSAH